MREAFIKELCTSFKNKKVKTFSGVQVRVVSEQLETGKAIIEPILGGTIHEVAIADLGDNACFGKSFTQCDQCKTCVANDICQKITSGQLDSVMEEVPAARITKTFQIDGKKVDISLEGKSYTVTVNGDRLKKNLCSYMLKALEMSGKTIAKSYEGSVSKLGELILQK